MLDAARLRMCAPGEFRCWRLPGECLMKLIDRYLAALVAGDPAAVPLAPEIRTVENLRPAQH